jgi:hypothetical protein
MAATPTTKEQDFPSLSEAASIRSKSKTSNNNNNIKKQVVNFAAIASKNKDQPIKKRNKLPAGNNNKSYYASIQKLKKPVQIPWLETGSSLHSVYMKEVRKNKLSLLLLLFTSIMFTEKTGDRVWHVEKPLLPKSRRLLPKGRRHQSQAVLYGGTQVQPFDA